MELLFMRRKVCDFFIDSPKITLSYLDIAINDLYLKCVSLELFL